MDDNFTDPSALMSGSLKNFFYAGNLVTIEKENFYTLDFFCEFEWDYYPFDTQLCSVDFAVDNAASHHVLNISVNNAISEYETFSVTLNSEKLFQQTNKGRPPVRVIFKYKRKLNPIILNTFLPTIILTMINQLTNYFKGRDMFEAIIGINATVLMALATVFIDVFNSLPRTLYVKMMDIWMIATFIYPFVVIFSHTTTHVTSGYKWGIKVKKICMFFSKIGLPFIFILFSFLFFNYGINLIEKL